MNFVGLAAVKRVAIGIHERGGVSDSAGLNQFVTIARQRATKSMTCTQT